MTVISPDLVAISARRLRMVPIADGESSLKRKLIFLSEVASLGYQVTNPDAFNDSALRQYPTLIQTLKEMKGGNVAYVPLFQKFPEDTPDDDVYFFKRIIGYLQNIDLEVDDGTEMEETGIQVPHWLFDLEEFGADPITQLQNETLFKKGAARQRSRKKDVRTEWVKIQLVSDAKVENALRRFLLDNLYAASSIKEALKEDLETLLAHFGTGEVDVARVTFKETQAYLMAYLWKRSDFDQLSNLVKNPTDLLRMFAALTETDISLAEKIKFPRFRRAQRRFVLEQLESCSNLEEDLKRYRGLWLDIGRYLHPGEYQVRFGKTFRAFDALRNSKIVTFDSQVEKLTCEKRLGELVELLSSRPGVFARKLHQVLEIAESDFEQVLQAFEKVAPSVTLKTLLVLDTYFQTIEQSEMRAIINKRGKIRVMKNRKNRLAKGAQQKVVETIKKSIGVLIARDKESWSGKSVWIDPALRNYTVPLSQRKASDGLLTVGRGSKLPLEAGVVLRLFVYWKEATRRTDLDLSLIQYDDEMNYLGHVSFTNLKAEGIAHSGDLQSAPHGAAEFIDVDLSYLKSEFPKCRYLASQINRYCGDFFGVMDCHAGWMLRDQVDSTYKTFDIKTVQNKFDLNGSASYSIPILVDLQMDEILFVDLYVSGAALHNCVEGSFDDVSIITREMVRMLDTRPNMHAVAVYHANHRGANLVSSKDKCDISFGVEDCDFTVTQIEKTLAELI